MWTAAGAKHLIVRRYTAIWSPNILTGVTIGETISEKREAILRIAAKHGATQVRLIGSVARCEARPDSDVDLLVTWQDGTSLVDRSEEHEAVLPTPRYPPEARRHSGPVNGVGCAVRSPP